MGRSTVNDSAWASKPAIGCIWESFKDKWNGRTEKKWKQGLCINFKKAVLPPALKTLQMLLFPTHPPTPPRPLLFFFLPGVFGDPMWKEQGRAIKATAVCYRLQNLGALVRPSAPIIISARPPRKARALGRENIWSRLLFARINSRTNDRWERGKGSRRTRRAAGGWGGGVGKWGRASKR